MWFSSFGRKTVHLNTQLDSPSLLIFNKMSGTVWASQKLTTQQEISSIFSLLLIFMLWLSVGRGDRELTDRDCRRWVCTCSCEDNKEQKTNLCSWSIKTNHWEIRAFLHLMTKGDWQIIKDRALSDSTCTKPTAESPLMVWGLWQASQVRAVYLPQVIHEAGVFLHPLGCGQGSMPMQAKFRTGAGIGQVQALPLPSLERRSGRHPFLHMNQKLGWDCEMLGTEKESCPAVKVIVVSCVHRAGGLWNCRESDWQRNCIDLRKVYLMQNARVDGRT